MRRFGKLLQSFFCQLGHAFHLVGEAEGLILAASVLMEGQQGALPDSMGVQEGRDLPQRLRLIVNAGDDRHAHMDAGGGAGEAVQILPSIFGEAPGPGA